MIDYYREKFFDYISGDDIYTETVNGERNKAYLEFKSNFKPAFKSFKTAILRKRWDDASKYCDECEKLLNDVVTYLKKLDVETSGGMEALATISHAVTTIGKGLSTYVASKLVYAGINEGYKRKYNTTSNAVSKSEAEKRARFAGAYILTGHTLSNAYAVVKNLQDKKKNGEKISARDFNAARATTLVQVRKLANAFAKTKSKYLKKLEKAGISRQEEESEE